MNQMVFFSTSPMIDYNRIRQKVRTLVKAKGMKKTKLGDVLGGYKPGEDKRVQINRANRFLSGDKAEISVRELERLAEFFDKTLEWFLEDQDKQTSQLSSPDKYTPSLPKSFEDLRKALEGLGYDESTIEHEMMRHRAMEAYRHAHGQ